MAFTVGSVNPFNPNIGAVTAAGGVTTGGAGAGRGAQPQDNGYSKYTGIVNSDLNNLAVNHHGKSGVANTICIA